MEDEHDFTKLYENENSEDSSALFQNLVICLIAFLDSCLILTLSWSSWDIISEWFRKISLNQIKSNQIKSTIKNVTSYTIFIR